MAETTEVILDIKVDSKDATRELSKFEKEQEKTLKTSEELGEELGQMNGALDGLLESLGIAPGTLNKVGTGLKSVSKATNGWKVALASLGIGAIILALTSLVAWFSKTKKGQEVLAKVTGGLSGVIAVLTDGVSALGEIIYNAFSNPQEAVISLYEIIRDNIVNRVKAIGLLFEGLGDTIKASLELDFEGVKKGLTDTGQAFIQFQTGLDKQQQEGFVNALADGFERVADAAEKGAEASNRETKLRERKIAFITQEARLQTEISNRKLESENLDRAAEDRLKDIQKANQLVNELYKEKGSLLKEEIAILEERQALGQNTLDDNEELAELQAQLILFNKERADQLTEIQSKEFAIKNEIEAQNQEKEKGLELDNEAEAKLEERNRKAEERILLLKEREAIERANQIEGAQAQADALIEIENQRYLRELENKELTDREKEEQELIHQNNLNAINENAVNKQIELNNKLAETEQQNVENTLNMSLDAINTLASGNKDVAVAIATINTFQAITKALAEGGVFGAIQAVSIAALGFKQVADIQATDVPKASKGMVLSGPSHANGGILVSTPGGLIEAEGKEAIVNKNTMQDPFLSQVVSWANEMGGGIPLAARGMNITDASNTSTFVNAGFQIERAIQTNPPVLVTERLDTVQNEVAVSNQISTL